MMMTLLLYCYNQYCHSNEPLSPCKGPGTWHFTCATLLSGLGHSVHEKLIKSNTRLRGQLGEPPPREQRDRGPSCLQAPRVVTQGRHLLQGLALQTQFVKWPVNTLVTVSPRDRLLNQRTAVQCSQ